MRISSPQGTLCLETMRVVAVQLTCSQRVLPSESESERFPPPLLLTYTNHLFFHYTCHRLVYVLCSRLYAAISSRPGQCGRCDGYILEGKELEFYLKKMQKKKGKAAA